MTADVITHNGLIVVGNDTNFGSISSDKIPILKVECVFYAIDNCYNICHEVLLNVFNKTSLDVKILLKVFKRIN